MVEARTYLDKHGFIVRTSRLSSIKYLLKIVDKLVRVTNTYERVRTGQFGIIGGVSPWLIYSRLEPGSTAGRELGEIVEVPINELYKLYNEMDVSVEEVESIVKKSSSVNLENTLLEISKSLKVYKALEQLIEKHQLSAATLKCFDLIKDLKTTGCLAISLLNSKLIPIACEGDVPLLHSMAIGTWISSNPVFMANLADIDDDTITLAHCTSWLAGPYHLYTHFESSIGIGLRVEYPVNTKATIFRLDPEFTVMRIGVGDLVEHSWKPYMCRTQVKVKLTNARKLLDNSIGNHYALLLGDYSEELELFSNLVNIHVDYV